MPDREKVAKGLECHKNSICEDGNRKLCPYWKDTHCSQKLSADALALLKEQDEHIKMLEHQIETITKWRANAGAFD